MSGVVVIAVIAVTAAFWVMFGRSTTTPDQVRPELSASGASGSLPSVPLTGPSVTTPPEPEVRIEARVEPLMQSWRTAIINKDAETVEALDRTFAAHPRAFVAALMSSAEGDSEERVRSFSTRVLGKLRPIESAELMRKLLADRSEYVRFNAAWALGELDDRGAAARLRRLERHDPSPTVRRSATDSLRKMEGS